MIYLLVLFGSFFGICAVLGARVLLRMRSVRRFVRSIRKRTVDAAERGALLSGIETPIARPRRRDFRTSAIELQKVRSLVRQAEKTQAQRKYSDAESLLIQALTISPASHDIQAQLARLYLETERPAKAEAMYREILEREDEVSFHANLGLACYKQGKYIEACAAYRGALERDPKNPVRQAALGRACIAGGDFERAVQELEKACARLSRDTELLHLLAFSYEKLSAWDQAQAVYRRINKLEPYNEGVKEKITSLAQA